MREQKHNIGKLEIRTLAERGHHMLEVRFRTAPGQTLDPAEFGGVQDIYDRALRGSTALLQVSPRCHHRCYGPTALAPFIDMHFSSSIKGALPPVEKAVQAFDTAAVELGFDNFADACEKLLARSESSRKLAAEMVAAQNRHKTRAHNLGAHATQVWQGLVHDEVQALRDSYRAAINAVIEGRRDAVLARLRADAAEACAKDGEELASEAELTAAMEFARTQVPAYPRN